MYEVEKLPLTQIPLSNDYDYIVLLLLYGKCFPSGLQHHVNHNDYRPTVGPKI